MALSRKHYVKVADVLAGELALARHAAHNEDNPLSATVQEAVAQVRTIRNITLSLADVFAQDNPNFDRDRFYAAVGLS